MNASIADMVRLELIKAESGSRIQERTRKWKAAVLVTKPVQHGVAMQYGAWTDDVHEMTIFTDRALALDWLMS
jgi:hypothetical protein